MMRLQGKSALITGAARGIGRGFAEAYAREGASVAIADINLEAARATASEIGEAAYPVHMDVTRQESIDAAIETVVATAGKLDILINNAALFDAAETVDITRESYEKLYAVNVAGTLFTMQAAARQMIRQGHGGKIINMASQAGRRGESLVLVYCSTKAAVISMTQSAGLNLIITGLGVALIVGVVMLATAVLALSRLEDLMATADLAAAMTLDAFAGRSGALRPEVHALRPHPGQVETAARLRALLEGSNLVDIPYHLVPRFRTWTAESWSGPQEQQRRFDIGWDYVPPSQRHGREAFYQRFLPFKGGKKHQPQDAYCLRCMPQVHGAVRDAWAQACRIIDIELNSVTDNPLVFPDAEDPRHIEDQVISAGHFHGMPLALAMSYVKAAIPVLASISERRLNKLVDPANNDGLPAFLIGNEDATDSGFMIVQYTAAALVNDLATRAHPASVYSIPTSANAEDHVSMGTNEARHVLDMTEDLGHVLALELYTAAQALEYRQDMLNAARSLAARGDWTALAEKIGNAPREGHPSRAAFEDEIRQLMQALTETGEFHAGSAVRKAHARIRESIDFMQRDRAMDGDVRRICELVASNALLGDLS